MTKLKEKIFNMACALSTQEMSSHDSPTVIKSVELAAPKILDIFLEEAERWNAEKVVDYQGNLRPRGAMESSQLIQHLKSLKE